MKIIYVIQIHLIVISLGVDKITREEAIKYGKEQLDVFGGKHAEFIKSVIELLEQEKVGEWIVDENKKEIDK